MTDMQWQELGIPPTSDGAAIRRAYASRLKTLDIDRDPAAFIRLRRAYEEALCSPGVPTDNEVIHRQGSIDADGKIRQESGSEVKEPDYKHLPYEFGQPKVLGDFEGAFGEGDHDAVCRAVSSALRNGEPSFEWLRWFIRRAAEADGATRKFPPEQWTKIFRILFWGPNMSPEQGICPGASADPLEAHDHRWPEEVIPDRSWEDRPDAQRAAFVELQTKFCRAIRAKDAHTAKGLFNTGRAQGLVPLGEERPFLEFLLATALDDSELSPAELEEIIALGGTVHVRDENGILRILSDELRARTEALIWYARIEGEARRGDGWKIGFLRRRFSAPTRIARAIRDARILGIYLRDVAGLGAEVANARRHASWMKGRIDLAQIESKFHTLDRVASGIPFLIIISLFAAGFWISGGEESPLPLFVLAFCLFIAGSMGTSWPGIALGWFFRLVGLAIFAVLVSLYLIK